MVDPGPPSRLFVFDLCDAAQREHALCAALDDTGIAGHPEEHFEVLLETGQRRQPRDYFQRSNDPEVWALLDDPEFRDVLGEYGGRYAEHPARRDPTGARPTSRSW